VKTLEETKQYMIACGYPAAVASYFAPFVYHCYKAGYHDGCTAFDNALAKAAEQHFNKAEAS
jgi:hypothetical protein